MKLIGGLLRRVITYTYDLAGRLTGTDYSDTTPDVALVLDRTGRTLTATDGSGTRTHVYEGPGAALSGVSYSATGGSPLEGMTVAYEHNGNINCLSLY